MDPPPHTPVFTDIPPEVGTLFRRSFERGSETGTRPRPAEWLTSLKQLEKVIVECVDDPGHKYWRGANSCVWCRLAEHGGPEYYFGVAGKTVSFSADEAKLHKVLRRLSASQLNEFQFDVNRFSPKSRPIANRLPKHLHEQRSIETVLRVFTGLCLFTIPFGLWHGFISIIGALGAIVFGGGLAIFRLQSSWHQEYRRRRIAYKHALDVLRNLETNWQQIVQLFRRGHSVLSDRIKSGVTECRGLTSEYSIEIERLTISAEDSGRLRHLRLHLIADANIPEIGEWRTQTLAANSIITAADIDEHMIRRIYGFGDALTNNLLHWKKEVLRQFRFNSTSTVSPSEQRLIQVRFRTRQRQILFALDQQLSKLESLPLTCHAELQKLFPKLTAAVAEYEQTKADLELLTLKN